MQLLKFKENSNNKLDCKYFTTFRMSAKWKVGNDVIILLNDQFKIGRVIDAKPIHLSKLTDWHCFLDCGQDKETTLRILGTFYYFDLDNKNAIVYYYLVRTYDDWRKYTTDSPFIEIEK